MSDSQLVIPNQNISSYQLPLSSKQLDAALQRGHGRAYLHAIQHGIPTEKLVHVLTHNLRYDKQCEDGAQDWYLTMASRNPDYERVCDDVISSACDSQSAHDRYFVAYTLELLHRQGRSDAIDALYTLTECPIVESWETLPGAERLIELEGEKGLVHILQTIVKTGSLPHVQRWYIEHLFRQMSEESADRCESELAKLTSEHPELSQLLEIVRAPYPLRKRSTDSSGQRVSLSGLSNNQLSELSARDVIDCVRNARDDDHGRWMRRWAWQTSAESLNEIIDELLVEENPHRVHKYLQAFTKRSPLHRFDERMFDLLDHSTEKVRWCAHYALATCSDERVRELALQRFTPEHIEWGTLRLLQSTYQPGDHEYIESSLFIPSNTEAIHDIGFSLLDVFEQQTTPESLGSMLYIYEHGPCMNCRRHAIRVMQTAGVLPDWVKHEAQFDADEGIRELITGSESLPD